MAGLVFELGYVPPGVERIALAVDTGPGSREVFDGDAGLPGVLQYLGVTQVDGTHGLLDPPLPLAG